MTKVSRLGLVAIAICLGSSCASANDDLLFADLSLVNYKHKSKESSQTFDINGFPDGSFESTHKKNDNGIAFGLESLQVDEKWRRFTHGAQESLRVEGELSSELKIFDVVSTKGVKLGDFTFYSGGGLKYIDINHDSVFLPFFRQQVDVSLLRTNSYGVDAFLRGDLDLGLSGEIANGYELKTGLQITFAPTVAVEIAGGTKHFNTQNDVDSKFFNVGLKKVF